MKISEFVKKEFCGWGRIERIIFPLVITLVVGIALSLKDTTPAIISAICGICATILAGKGKISCYVFGMIANICYSYISYKNHFWGNLALNALYFFPMQFVGIAKWKNHLNQETQEIYKTSLNNKERTIYSILAIFAVTVLYFVLKYYNDLNPLVDSITTIFSVVAYIMTVKRCIEQWFLWTVVNALCVLMWIGAYINGSHCFATILMWFTYLILGIYFMHNWKKEIEN